jgi:hypothetical protein
MSSTVSLADFEPKRRPITNVTVAKEAVVTTGEDHGYTDGQLVRLYVLSPNPMVLDGVKGTVSVIDDTNFRTDVDTSTLYPFSTPSFPPAYTQAHVVPITGETQNTAT